MYETFMMYIKKAFVKPHQRYVVNDVPFAMECTYLLFSYIIIIIWILCPTTAQKPNPPFSIRPDFKLHLAIS